MRLIFIRHGDPNYQLDTLTERGWKEAEALFERVKKWKVDGNRLIGKDQPKRGHA